MNEILTRRPGYVYVFSNPALTGWSKVGHTYRPPHKRANELSRTALPCMFETAHARFFWDAFLAEQSIHRLLQADSETLRSGEFFSTPLCQLREMIDGLPDPGFKIIQTSVSAFDEDASWLHRSFEDTEWDRTMEGLEEQWCWGVEDISSSSQKSQRQGWRRLERLSSSGWGEASWRLSRLILSHQPNPQGAERAAWVAEAAEQQGVEGGSLRAAWLRSWSDDASFGRWKIALEGAWHRWGRHRSPDSWALSLVETLEAEQETWLLSPHRRIESPWWPALATRFSSQ